MSKRSRLLRDRLTRLHRLRKTALAPLSTRQNEHRASEHRASEHRANEHRASAQKPLPPPRRRRVSAWLLTPLVLIALLFCAFRLVVLPRVAFDLERTVRAQIIPQLQDRIGARVEIGRIESDYVSGVTLHDVVIGRGAKTPFGALMRAPKVQLELDLVSLAFNRTDATRALHRVLVQSPQLYIERDARGALNWTRLWKPQAQGASSRTSALFQVRNARVYLRDASLRSRDGKPLLARFDKVNFSAQTNGDNATSFDARAPLALIGAKSFDSAAGGALYTAKDISTSGQIAADASWITGKTRVPSVPAALPIEYSKGVNVGVLGQPAAASGKFAARFNFAWTKPRRNADLLQNLMLTGVLRAQNVGLTFAKNWPNTSQRAVVRNLNGLVEIDGRALQTRGISLDVLNTPMVFNGAMTLRRDALPVAALDVVARSSRLDVARLWSVFAPSLRAQNTALRDLALRGGIANGSVRIKGDATNPQINGEIAVANLSLQNRDARLQSGSLRLIAQSDLSSILGKNRAINSSLKGEVSLTNLVARDRDTRLQASSLRLFAQSNLRKLGGQNNAPINGEVSLVDLDVRNRNGRLQSSFLRIVGQSDLLARKGTVRFATRNLNANAAPGNATDNRVLVRASSSSGTALWSRDARALRLLDVAFQAPRYDVAARALAVSGRDLKARLNWNARNSQNLWTANWQTRAVSGRSSRADFSGDLKSALLRGQLAATSENFAWPTQATVRFAADDAQLQAARWGRGRFARARGALSWRKVGNAWPLQSDVALQNVSSQIGAALVSKLSSSSTRTSTRSARFVAAKALRVFAATTDANARRMVWNGVATFDQLDANSLRDMALSPTLAARVRDVGTLSGRARFFNVGGSSPVGSGEFRIARATIDNYLLRDLRGRVALDGNVVTLRNASARSEAGTLLLDADYDIRSGASSLGLNVPDVVVEAARINPFLRAMKLRFEGAARGTLRISTDSNAANSDTVSSLRVRFDLRSPQASIASLPAMRDVRVLAGDAVRMRDVRWRGEGTARRGDNGRWVVDGTSQITAARTLLDGARDRKRAFRVGDWTAPADARGSQISRLALALQGRIALRGAEKKLALPSIVPARATTLIVPTDVASGQVRGNLRAAEVVFPLRSTVRSDVVLRAVEAPFAWNGAQLNVPRFGAQLPQLQRIEYSISGAKTRRVARMATVEGHINFARGQWRGQVLARELDASRVQRLADALWRASNTSAAPLFGTTAVRGAAFVRADFSGNASDTRVGLQARLYNGALALPPNASPLNALPLSALPPLATSTRTTALPTPQIVPVEAALLRASYNTRGGAIGLRELTVWSRGARLSATGNVASAAKVATTQNIFSRNARTLPLDFDVQLNNVRVRDLRSFAPSALPQDVDGVLSGAFRLSGTTQSPRAVGRAALRLAHVADIAIDEATAQIRWENSPAGTRLALAEIVVRNDQTSLQGEAIADTRRNIWRANLSLPRAPAAQLLRALRALSPRVVGKDGQEVSWPLRGSVRAVVNLNGNFAKRDLLSARLKGGRALMNADDLRWRGRELGAMTANLDLRDGVLFIEDAALVRQLTLAEVAALRHQSPILPPSNNTSSTRDAKNADAVSDNELLPSLPNAPDDSSSDASSPDASSSDSASSNSEVNATRPQGEVGDVAVVRISGAIPLSPNADVKIGVRVENERFSVLRDLLTEAQRTLQENGQSVPLLQQAISSTRSVPNGLEGRVSANAQLTGSLRNLRVALDATVDNARLDAQDLPSLETSLVFERGAIEINVLEVKQNFPEESDGKSQVRETALRVAPGGRIVPGGEVSLDVDVLKANLSQLATWIPALRTGEGAPALNGELSLFSFEVRGQTASPQVTGSVEARDVAFNGTTFDRFRVTTFQIKDDVLSIEPGNFTVVKGGFQSSAAYGSVPWSWGGADKPVGPRRDGVLDVHLPLQTRDFGALSGAFIPALTNVSADEFLGSIDVTGTIDAPRIGGAVQFSNARFRVDPAVGPFPFGIGKMSGALRFVDGNRVLVEKLSGELERASDVRATSTGNAPAAQRSSQAALRALRSQLRGAAPPELAGSFTLAGSVELDLDSRRVSLDDLRLTSHRYDLSMTLQNGAIYSTAYSGARNIAVKATWKTGDGEPRRAQNIAWEIGAQGRNSLSNKLGRDARGTLKTQGTLRLATNFASSADALLRSRFDGDLNFKDFAWQMRGLGRGVVDGDLKLDNGVTARPGITPNTARARTVAAKPKARDTSPSDQTATPKNATQTRVSAQIGETASTLSKDIGAPSARTSSTRLADGTTVMTMPRRSLAQIIENPRATTARDNAATEVAPIENDLGYGDALSNDAASDEVVGAASRKAARSSAQDDDFKEESSGALPLRIAGDLILSKTEITGLPSGEGQAISTVFAAPFFDVLLTLGRDVRFTTSSMRAELTGEVALSGTPRQPRVQGVVSTRNGQLRFPNATARIEEGEITIDVVRDPTTQLLRSRATIDATARGQVGRYQITIALRGPLDLGQGSGAPSSGQNLRVDVTSNPPLSQDEAFAQLTGTSLRETTGSSNQTYASAVVNLLTAPLFSGLERSLEEALGLNSLTLDYRLNEPVGIQVGKALGDRVFVTYRRSLSRGNLIQPAYTIRLDVRVSGGVQVGAQADERGRKKLTVEKTFRF